MLSVAELQRALRSVVDDELEREPPDPGVDGTKRHAAVRIAARRDFALPFAEVENHGGAVASNRDLADIVARVYADDIELFGYRFDEA